MMFYISEYVTRLICSPNKLTFVKAPLNVIDLLAILPYFLSFAVEELKVLFLKFKKGSTRLIALVSKPIDLSAVFVAVSKLS